MKSFKEFLKEAKEKNLIYEMSAAVLTDTRMFWIENPNSWDNRYFKYLDSKSYSRAKKVKRISLINPKYMNHKDEHGKIEWDLTDIEIDRMIDILNTKKGNITNWQKILLTYNKDNCSLDDSLIISGDMKFDEYNELVDKNNQKHNRRAFRLDYQMPDYSKLKKGI